MGYIIIVECMRILHRMNKMQMDIFCYYVSLFFFIKALTLIYSIQNVSHKLKSGWCHQNDKYAAILAENCNLLLYFLLNKTQMITL